MDDFDRIMNMSEAELDAMIRAEGGDPADYARRGKQAAERALLTVRTFKAAQADLSIVKHQHALALQFTVGGLSFVIGDAPQTYETLSFRMMQFRKALCQLMEASRAGVPVDNIPDDPACTCGSDSPRAFNHALSCPHSTPWNDRVKARTAAGSTGTCGVEGSKP